MLRKDAYSREQSVNLDNKMFPFVLGKECKYYEENNVLYINGCGIS